VKTGKNRTGSRCRSAIIFLLFIKDRGGKTKMEEERFDELLEEIKDMNLEDLIFLREKVEHEIALKK